MKYLWSILFVFSLIGSGIAFAERAPTQNELREMFIGDFCHEYSSDVMIPADQREEGADPFRKQMLWTQIPDYLILNVIDTQGMTKEEKSIVHALKTGRIIIRGDTIYLDEIELGRLKDYLPQFCSDFVPQLVQ